MNFTNKKVKSTFGSSDAQNAWVDIETIGWKRVRPTSSDGVTNVLLMLNAATKNGLNISGSINSNDEVSTITLH